jgi:hypothetical protein
MEIRPIKTDDAHRTALVEVEALCPPLAALQQATGWTFL